MMVTGALRLLQALLMFCCFWAASPTGAISCSYR